MQYYTAGVYDVRGEWIPSHGQRCRCGLCWIGEECGYCHVVVAVAPSQRAAPKEVKRTRAQMREDAEIRLGKSRDEARARATEHIPSSAPSPVKAETTNKNAKQKRPRRTKAEMAQFRAAQAARLQEVAALKTPSWLTEDDPAVEAILAGTDVEEAMVKDVSSEITALLAGEDVK